MKLFLIIFLLFTTSQCFAQRGCDNIEIQRLNKIYEDKGIPQLRLSIDCSNPKIVYINRVQFSDDNGKLYAGDSQARYVSDMARSDGVPDPITTLITSGKASQFTTQSYSRGPAQAERESKQLNRELITAICNSYKKAKSTQYQCSLAGDYRNCMNIRAGSDWEEALGRGMLCN
jgi:hypothetical protein